MKIKKVQFRNVLSYGNKLIEWDFSNPETILLTGENGAGKTTLLDVIHFNLTGKPFRKITLGQFINSKNNKNLETCVEYESDTGVKLKVIRNKKPDLFELYINDSKKDQDLSPEFQSEIQRILKFNPKNIDKLFLISTASYKPFFSSTLDEKRKIIDQLIEIESFSKMTESMKKDRTIEKEKIKDVDFEIDKLKSNIDIIEDFNKKIDESNKDVEFDEEIKKIKIEALQLKKLKQETQDRIDSLQISTNDMIEKKLKQSQIIIDMITELEKHKSSLKTKKESLNDKTRFFVDNESCVVCQQSISEEHKKAVLWELEKEQLQLDDEDFKNDKRQKKIDLCQKKTDDLNKRITTNEKLLSSFNSKLLELRNKQLKLKTQYQVLVESKKSQKTVDKKDTTKLLTELNECYEKKNAYIKNLDVIETSIKMMGEKYLRAHIIKKYVPVINKSLNEYLEIFGLKFKITIDKEFKETFHDRYYSKLSYHGLSEGEKLRVNLSLIFSFLDVTANRQKQSSNVLFLDEVVSSSADEKCLTGLGDIVSKLHRKGLTVFVISHDKNIQNFIDFSKHYYIMKESSFSNIIEK